MVVVVEVVLEGTENLQFAAKTEGNTEKSHKLCISLLENLQFFSNSDIFPVYTILQFRRFRIQNQILN